MGVGEFLLGREWSPLFSEPRFGVLPLLSGTLLITGIAVAVAIPLGLGSAIYLSEYAPDRVRRVLKPALELLAGVPTIVFGYFALTFFTPVVLRDLLNVQVEVFNALSAGIVMGFMVLPTIASVAEDALSAVPAALRQGAFGLGASKLQTSLRVVLPAALSGVVAAIVLGVSRAVGETMIVLVAAGQVADLSLDPGDPTTMTSFIAAGQGRRAHRVGRLRGDLRGGHRALRDHPAHERRLHPLRPPLQGGLRVNRSAPLSPHPTENTPEASRAESISVGDELADAMLRPVRASAPAVSAPAPAGAAPRPIGKGSAPARAKGAGFHGLLLGCLLMAISLLFVLVADVVRDGLPALDLQFLTSFPSFNPEIAGLLSALVGSLWLMALCAAFVIPVGVATAVYLEEYADQRRWWNRLIEVNIQNLAAVPSVVYGILGLAFLVRGPIPLGRVLLAGALTLGLLVLPVVIIAGREAIRAVPPSIREGSLALGATQWQTIWRQVLPAAIPGIATGVILALSRAIGETAPLIVVGAAAFVAFNPRGPLDAFTALPIQIFDWISRPQAEFQVLAAAGIVVLLVLLLLMNFAAITLRNRYERKW